MHTVFFTQITWLFLVSLFYYYNLNLRSYIKTQFVSISNLSTAVISCFLICNRVSFFFCFAAIKILPLSFNSLNMIIMMWVTVYLSYLKGFEKLGSVNQFSPILKCIFNFRTVLIWKNYWDNSVESSKRPQIIINILNKYGTFVTINELILTHFY